jgi:hypothetical protein
MVDETSNEIFALLRRYSTQIGSLLPTFRNNLSVLLSRVKQSKKNAGNTYVRSYAGNGVGGDWFSENVPLVSRVSGRQEGSRFAWGGCFEGKGDPEDEFAARFRKGGRNDKIKARKKRK